MPADQQYQDRQEHYSAEPIHGIDEISVPTQAASNNWVANAFTGWLGVSIMPSDKSLWIGKLTLSFNPISGIIDTRHMSYYMQWLTMTKNIQVLCSGPRFISVWLPPVPPGSQASQRHTLTGGSPSVRLGVFQATWFGGTTDSSRLLLTWLIPSRYGIFTNIWLICMVNVGKYAIHGSYGWWCCCYTPSSFTYLSNALWPSKTGH